MGSRTLEEGPIVLDFFLPATQDSLESLEPPVCAFHLGLIVAMGTGDDGGDRQAGTLGHPVTFGVPLSSIRGIGTGSFSSWRSFRHRTIQPLPESLETLMDLLFPQRSRAQPGEYPIVPLLKSIVHRGRCSQTPWKRFSVDAGAVPHSRP